MKKPKSVASDIPVWCSHDKLVDISELVPNPRNNNTHGDLQVALLAKIIRNQGWRNPIVVSTRSGFVIKGHGRMMAAEMLKVEKVPVDYQDYSSEAAEYADLLADNKIAQYAEFDQKMTKDLLSDLDSLMGLKDIDLTGFTKEEFEKMITPPMLADIPDPNGEPSTIKCPHCGKSFEK